MPDAARSYEPGTVLAAQLDCAYAHCRAMTAHHSRSFSLAARLLPAGLRPAIWALYAFCRTVDDTVDCAPAEATAVLHEWRRVTLQGNPSSDDAVAIAWSDALERYAIPRQYALELIDGVERDLLHNRYETFDDLSAYCYGVASTVGLMSMHIVGFSGPEAIPHAIKLGIALQMTNILRDVGEDWRTGRLYLPLEELARYGLTEADIARGEVTDDWRRFMQFQLARTRALYHEAWPGISMLNTSGRMAIAAAASFYRGILAEIERLDYNVFAHRASLSKWGKLRQLPGLWWQTRARRYQWQQSSPFFTQDIRGNLEQ
jgi:15-cis-phytoene synthase